MTQTKNPLHGITLKTIVEELVTHYGWESLGAQIKIKCFTEKPSINSSLTFLRKTQWAREKVEQYYIWTFFTRTGERKSADKLRQTSVLC
jgi:uncharacterized protein (DUF2132 family)